MRPLAIHALLLALATAACSGDKETASTDTASGTTTVDAAAACTDLCTSSGFDSGSADAYEHEVNCFCEGGDGSGMVDAGACTDMCTDLGWSAGEAFDVNACQCS